MEVNNYNENDFLKKIVNLEKRLKFFKIIVSISLIILVILIMGLSSWFFKAQSKILPTTDTISAKSFMIVDGDGKLRGEISCKKDEKGMTFPIIALKDDSGNNCMELTAYKDPKISIQGKSPNIEIIGDNASLNLRDSQFSNRKRMNFDINSFSGSSSIFIQTCNVTKDKPLYNVFSILVPDIELKNKDILSGPVIHLSCDDGLNDNWSFINLNVYPDGSNIILKTNKLNLSQTEISAFQGRPSISLFDSMKPSGLLVNRATFGSIDLINENTGIQEKRPPSSLVLFNKEGKVIWKTP